MQIGITDYFIKKYGLAEGARRMADAGYSFIDYQLADAGNPLYEQRDEDFLRMITDIRRELNRAGIKVVQIHGPFGDSVPDTTDEERAIHFEKMTKALVMAKYLGANYMAVHPLLPFGITGENPNEVYAINKKFYQALANVAGKLGVTLCLENLPFAEFSLSPVEAVVDFIKEINHPNLKMCFDTGHANIYEGRISEKLSYGGDLIKIIHVHDNRGESDEHLCPYEGTIDWADFAEGLFNIGYEGVFNLETAPVSKKRLEEGISDEELSEAEEAFLKTVKLIAG